MPPLFQSIIPVLFIISICMHEWLFVGTTHEKKTYEPFGVHNFFFKKKSLGVS